jgi:hypothetical protein
MSVSNTWSENVGASPSHQHFYSVLETDLLLEESLSLGGISKDRSFNLSQSSLSTFEST